jgi:glycosyltransferase involved in cell wall biosynthesis
MRVAVVAHALRSSGGLIIGLSLVEAMVKVAPGIDYCFVVPSHVGYEEVCSGAPSHTTVTVDRQGALARLEYDNVRLPRILKRFEPDVVLALDSSHAMAKSEWPQAVLVHAAHLFYPKTYFGQRTKKDRLRHAYLRSHFQRCLGSVDLIFVQTRVVAERFRSTYQYDGGIEVCGSAPPTWFHDVHNSVPRSELADFSQKFKLFLPARYYPHKNIERVIEVFLEFGDELGDVVTLLTVDPGQHRQARALIQRIDDLGLAHTVRSLGEVPQQEMRSYYASIDALLMPTLLETFCLPYIEAMTLGVPILTSDLDFAHELCGDAALYFDPWDSESVKDSIVTVRRPEVQRELAGAASLNPLIDRTWVDVASDIVSGLAVLARTNG